MTVRGELPDGDGGTTVLRAAGEPGRRRGARPAAGGAGARSRPPRPVVLDLSAVTFFDSSGVRLVDTLARECGARATPFRVVAPPGGPSRRVLELVGLADALSPATTWPPPSGSSGARL